MVDLGCGCDSIELPFGPSGNDGKNVYNVTTGPFVQPVIGSNETVVVSDSGSFTNQWAAPGNIISIFDSLGAGGFYQVVSISGTTQIVVKNLGYTGSSPATVTTILTGAKVAPSGVVGAVGATGATGGTGATGPAGVAITLIKTYTDTSTRSVPNTAGFDLIPAQTFSASTLCPQNGDAGKIKGYFALIGVTPDNTGRAADIRFFIGKTGTSFNEIGPITVLGSNLAYNEQLLLRNVNLQSSNNYSFISFEITIKRISINSSMILVEWRLMNLVTQSQVGSFIGSSLVNGFIDFNVGSSIDFGVRSDATYTAGGINVSLASLTVEKIIQ